MTTSLLPPVHRLADKARHTVRLVIFDESGTAGKGGNGGLLSRETIRAASELRLALGDVPYIVDAMEAVIQAWAEARPAVPDSANTQALDRAIAGLASMVRNELPEGGRQDQQDDEDGHRTP